MSLASSRWEATSGTRAPSAASVVVEILDARVWNCSEGTGSLRTSRCMSRAEMKGVNSIWRRAVYCAEMVEGKIKREPSKANAEWKHSGMMIVCPA